MRIIMLTKLRGGLFLTFWSSTALVLIQRLKVSVTTKSTEYLKKLWKDSDKILYADIY